MKRFRGKLTYSNVVSTLCLFLLVGGGTAFAANQLGKNSVGSKQLKKNAVTAAKIKKGAITAAKLGTGAVTAKSIATGTVTGEKIAAGTITGDKINASTLGTVPSSATTNTVKSSQGTLKAGEKKPVFSYGPFTITADCKEYEAGELGDRFTISSSMEHSVFTSWEDVGSDLGPATPEEDRKLSDYDWANSSGPFEGEPPFDTGTSAWAPNGQGFNAFIGEGNELDTNTCWYSLSASILG
jgi:hypothetical protein